MKGKKRAVILAVLLVAIWNIVVVAGCFVLDRTDPYYAVEQERCNLSEEEMLAACADALISQADQEWLLSILNDPVVGEQLPVEHGRVLWLAEDDCNRLISQYQQRPSDICRISVSQSKDYWQRVVTYINIEFYETEEDKGDAPSVAYPVLELTLDATGYPEENQGNSFDALDSEPVFSYRKEVYRYALKVPYYRIGTSSWGGPSAAYRSYYCGVSPAETILREEEKILTPMKHHHLYLAYFGWFEALMSV